ncbi:MAG: ribbon-helix-helix protein, CopG family [Deltaproteobacteria bacterium]|nr:ribbon-helix-helix protein, CopG family [Deltaproteobacteria bacterium]
MKTIVMPDEQWAELRVQAIRERRSASDIIRKLVSDYLKRAKKKAGE